MRTCKVATLNLLVEGSIPSGLTTSKPASRKGPTPAPRWRPVKVKGKPLSQTVIDDREDRV